jgi:hypothetical protein
MPANYLYDDEAAARQASTPMIAQQPTSGAVWRGTIAGQPIIMGGVSTDAEAYERLRRENSDLLERGGLKPDFAQALYGFDDATLKSYKKAHKAFNEATDMDSSFEKIGKSVKFQWDRAKNIVREVAADPTRAVTGIDPISTSAWNNVLGTDNRALVNQLGGARERDFQRYEAEHGRDALGASRSLSTAADYTAGLLGAAGAANGIANLFSPAASGAAAGGGNAGGSAGYYGAQGGNYVGGFAPAAGESVTVGTQGLGSLVGSAVPGTTSSLGTVAGASAGGAATLAGGASNGLGVFGGGGAAGTAGLGGGNAGALASSGGISGGAGIGSATAGGGAAGGGMGASSGNLWQDLLPLATQLGGSWLQSQGAKDAARASAAGDAAAIAEQRRQFDIIMGMLEPQRQFGNNSLDELSRLNNYPGADGKPRTGVTGLDVFTASPDYQFRRDEGNRDINNSFAARGGALSGNALRTLNQYNSDLASGEFGNYYNRRLAGAGLGQVATGQGVGAATNAGNNVSNLLSQQGNARASGIVDSTNAWTNGLNQAGQWYGNWLRNRQQVA